MSEAAQIVRDLKRVGIKEPKIAAFVGISQSAVNDWVNKGATPSSRNMDKLRALAKIHNIEFTSGEVVELRRLSVDEEHMEEQEYLASREKGYGGAGGFSPSIEGGIPEVDVLAGAGTGAIGEVINLRIGANTVSGHKVVEEWKMPEAYLSAELHVSPYKSLIMPVVGDSMTPTYQPGDRILVDLNQTEMTIDAVYVISDGDSPPQIKRLQRVLFSKPAMVDIISDNPSHQPQRVELAHLAIIGRVAGKVSKQ